MYILVINAGSSSFKIDLINTISHKIELELKAERLPATPVISINKENIPYDGVLNAEEIMRFCLLKIQSEVKDKPISGIGHRIAHGADFYDQPVCIDEQVIKTIEQLSALAPLHHPAHLLGIRIAKEIFGNTIEVAVFDTAFNQTLPKRAQYYAIDKQIAEKYRIRRYGFHGTSHQYVAQRAAQYLKQDLKNLRIISCHLGNGASVCAIEFGRSIETSMGMTPMEGLVMGTRSGDIDAGVITLLQEKENWTSRELESFLNTKSGLQGLSGLGNDMRDIIQQAEHGNENARLAIQVFTHRLTKYIGAYAALMNGVDVLVFTAGIGENSAEIRNRVCLGMDFMGIKVDEHKNSDAKLTEEQDVISISDENSRVKVLTVKTNEQLAIALETEKLILQKNKVNTESVIPIAVSARHVHLTRATLDLLYGKDYELTEYKPLSQPGQFAANETVTLIGPKNKIEKVRILGPLRPKDQVEISKTDEFFLGIDAPVRDSGNVAGTPGITLSGPKGIAELKEGVIIAWRHIHMHPNDAILFGVKDKDVVNVDVHDEDRPLTFKNVLIRVSDKFKLEMHIDTDEANAAEIVSGEEGVLSRVAKTGCLIDKHV